MRLCGLLQIVFVSFTVIQELLRGVLEGSISGLHVFLCDSLLEILQQLVIDASLRKGDVQGDGFNSRVVFIQKLDRGSSR